MNCKLLRPNAGRRMFCFPWMGGGASFFLQMSEDITDEIEVHALCLPGRENRFKEEGYKCFKDLIEDMVQLIHDKYSDKPFIFFGHSMGALISFFIAVELKKNYGIEPERMILSGTTAPNVQGLKEKRLKPHELTKDVFLSKLQDFGGTPPELLDYPELIDIYYPVMVADLSLIGDMIYKHPEEAPPPLDCAITFFDGDEDTDHSIDEWRKLTSGVLNYRQMPGAHFYLKQPDNKRNIVSFINMKYGSDHDIV